MRRSSSAALALLVLAGTGATAQTLDVKRRPAAASLLCDRPVEAPVCRPGRQGEVDERVSAATQAMILGDLDRATALLDEALALDPCAAEAAYLQGRIVAQQENVVAAAPWFCRYVALSPFGVSSSEARRQLEQAVEQGAGASLLQTFRTGVARFDEGRWNRAEELFTVVLERRMIPEAAYNRAVTRLSLGRRDAARIDLVRYLELRPESEDRIDVEYALQQLNRGPRGRRPAAAFALGMVLPGAGQYYTGRWELGLAVTGLVAGAAITGYVYERTTVWCRAPSLSGDCPDDAVARSETERPLLVPAVAAGLGLVLVSAIEATLHARSHRPPLDIPLGSAGTLRIDVAVQGASPDGATHVQLLRLQR